MTDFCYGKDRSFLTKQVMSLQITKASKRLSSSVGRFYLSHYQQDADSVHLDSIVLKAGNVEEGVLKRVAQTFDTSLYFSITTWSTKS